MEDYRKLELIKSSHEKRICVLLIHLERSGLKSAVLESRIADLVLEKNELDLEYSDELAAGTQATETARLENEDLLLVLNGQIRLLKVNIEAQSVVS